MIYYTPPSIEAVQDAIVRGLLGCITTPDQGNLYFPEDWDTIADNGCFISPKAAAAGKTWDERAWWSWLVDQPRSIRFATCPDVFDSAQPSIPQHEPTLERWNRYSGQMRRAGFTPAFVLQIGVTESTVPPDADVLFIGGDDAFKTCGVVQRIVRQAKDDGRWVHCGRVNTLKRMIPVEEMGCDSADGTYVTYGPDKNLPRLLRFLRMAEERAAAQPPLDLWQ